MAISMKVNVLEAHDRLKHLIKDQSENIYKGSEDCLLRNPLSLAIQDKSPYVYIFAHTRKTDNGINERLLWQPRLSIPKPQSNSYLFRAISKTDLIEVIWMIPPRERWNEYKQGNVTESNWSAWSIHQFKTNKESLEKPHPDDLPEEKARLIMKQIVDDHLAELKRKNSKPKILEASSSFYSS